MPRFLAALLALALFCLPAPAATLLPPGEQQFLDGNGKPLAGGTIAFYVPNTTTVKQTWSDPGQTVLNSNPVVLDSAGRAKIYGAGAYRQVLKDRVGNLIYDQLTADTSSSQIAWGGTSTGSANAQVVSATNFTSADGQIVGFIAGYTNTGQLAVSANGSGFIPILTDGPSGSVNLTGQEIQAGAAVLLIYDAGRGAFHLVGGQGGTGGGFGAQQSLAAANVTDLGLVSTHNALITGAANITSFGSSASTTTPVYALTFGGASRLVGSASLLIANGGLTAQAGDTAIVLYQGAGAWRVLSYTPASGGPAPPGMIAPFASSSCPAGWLSADGTPLSRSDYAPLFAAIGTAWGAGDGSSTFGRPDLRGFFLRGLDAGAGRDAGRALASSQADSVGSHEHNVPVGAVTVSSQGQGPISFYVPSNSGTGAIPTTGQAPPSSGETRPINVAMNFCVKL